MMKRVVTVLALAAIDLPAAAQNGVYKCTDSAGAVVYQGSPCQAQQAQMTLVEPRKRDPLIVNAEPTTGQPQPEGDANRSVLAGNELAVGMSDTKVLNMRGWGRPQNIARSRAEDGWREAWTYVSRGDGSTRLVQFVNGKVIGVTSQDTQQLARARLEAQQRIEAQQVVQASPRSQTGGNADPTARADEAVQIAQRLAGSQTPPTATVDWQGAAASSRAELQSVPAPVEAHADAQQFEAVPVAPPATVARPAPSAQAPPRQSLHVIRNEPPVADAAPPEAVMQSSAGAQFAVGEQPVTQ